MSESTSDSNSQYDTGDESVDGVNELLADLKLNEPSFNVIDSPGHYFPSSKIQNAAKNNFSSKSLVAINSEFETTPKLSEDNTHKVFENLLQIEDVVTLQPYPALCQSHATVNFEEKSNTYWFYLNSSNFKNIVKPKADEVVLIASNGLNRSVSIDSLNVDGVIGIVQYFKNQKVHFELSDGLKLDILNKRFDIVIRPNRLSIRYQYKALDMLAASPDIRKYLFPNHIKQISAVTERRISLFNEDIYNDEQQLQAVQMIVNDGAGLVTPYIIFGPSGSGKTTTITETILQLQCGSKKNRILVTASSISACDTIAMKLCQYYEKHECEYALIRLYNKTASKNCRPVYQLLKKYSNYNFNVDLPTAEQLRCYGIIVTTLTQVGQLVSGDIGKGAHFTHVFIDEAGASTEPETLVGIMGIKSSNCRIILAGDNKELGSALKSKHAAGLGLQQSLMVRLMARECYAVEEHDKYNHACQIRLRRNYRLNGPSFEVTNPPGHYFPSSKIQKACKDSFSLKALSRISSEFKTTPKISKDNINEVFKTLLEIEDFTNLQPYPPLCQRAVSVNIEDDTYWFELKHPHMKNIITPKSDEVVIIRSNNLLFDNKSINILNVEGDVCGIIHHIENQKVYFDLDDDHLRSAMDLKNQIRLQSEFDIIIRPNRMPIRYQYKALEELAESKDICGYLFPNHIEHLKAVPKRRIALINTGIHSNPEQLQAVHVIVNNSASSHTPYIIFGPPGTGKTATITEAILQLRYTSPKSRILITAGSNSACDTIALRLSQYYEEYKRDYSLIRLYSKSASQNRRPVDPLLKQYSNYSSHGNLPCVEKLRRYGIIVVTLSQVGKLVSGDMGEGAHFTHIFIDEAGASTEPETLVGIMGIKSSNCRIILSGDHKQLGPVLKSKHAAGLGLQQSLMERLMARDCYAVDASNNYNRACQIRLRRNYRSHPQIVHLYNHLYYNGHLLAENRPDAFVYVFPKIKDNLQKFPIIFQTVNGTCAKDKKSSSSYNEEEVIMVIQYLRNVLKGTLNGEKVTQLDVGIISPYKQQCRLIQQELKQGDWKEIEVGSTEAFQGREKQIIIASLVRSNSGLGFVNEPRRLNVMLSRAKSLLILIGNPTTLGKNKDFKFVIEQCEQHKTLRPA